MAYHVLGFSLEQRTLDVALDALSSGRLCRCPQPIGAPSSGGPGGSQASHHGTSGSGLALGPGSEGRASGIRPRGELTVTLRRPLLPASLSVHSGFLRQGRPVHCSTLSSLAVLCPPDACSIWHCEKLSMHIAQRLLGAKSL